MACDITIIMEDYHKVINNTIKGNAESITQVDSNTFHIVWGEQYMVKTKPQAVNMAEKKVSAVRNALVREGFSYFFGPFVEMDESSDEHITITKTSTDKLERALELRNQAEDQGVPVEDVMSDQDREMLNNEQVGEVTSTQEIPDTQSLTQEALKYANEIKSDVFRDMFKKNPEEFLKYIAEQSYGISAGTLTASESAEYVTVQYFGQNLVDIAKRIHPANTLINAGDLPPIQPEC